MFYVIVLLFLTIETELSKEVDIIKLPERIELKDTSKINNDTLLLTMLCKHECVACSNKEQQLIVETVLNRVNDSRFPNTIKEVVFQSKQFSGVNSYNYVKSKYFKFSPYDDYDILLYIRVHDILTGLTPKLSDKVLFFCNYSTATSKIKYKMASHKLLFDFKTHHLFASW